MNVRIHSIQHSSLVDGPGERTVIFFQGCSLHCPGCQNAILWPAAGGFIDETAQLAAWAAWIARDTGAITISGGEPFQQPAALAALVSELKVHGIRSILVYTGYTWEELMDPDHPAHPYLKDLLPQIDILVDGRFVQSLDDPLLSWRGSRNQRPIDVQSSLETEGLVVLDWDAPQVAIDAGGSVFLPVGLAPDFAAIGSVEVTRRCGQTK